MLAIPSISHSFVMVSLSRIFSSFPVGKPCKVLIEPNVRFPKWKDSVFQPDLVVVCDKNKITEDYVVGAPDLIIEILSPSTASIDRELKLNAYKDAGVLEYWLVDPLQKMVEVFQWKKRRKSAQYWDGDVIRVGVLDGLEVDLTEVFSFV